ncbi:hypothetical protein EVAR_9378_1 [Eumeta japonica]|uniref:Serine racemase n=1 Tax=Eumeta variegata TaxID=151549 RepID=A0A4C1UDS6_EUMVA|nr:hypothetical protein EVAR_9378_1 [Eumeta japonica]
MNEPEDPLSDPNNPIEIHYDDILAAAHRISGMVSKTPCSKCRHLSEHFGIDLYWKQEFLQYSGSFKERGVLNSLLQLDENAKKRGVVAATIGNHGIALSYIASSMRIPCTLVLPNDAPIRKHMSCANYGAKIHMYGNNIIEAKKFALHIAKEKKMTFIDSYDHPHVIEGAGTVGLEILEQLPTVDAILVPVGGGGLIAGIAVAVKHLNPDVEIYEVETETTSSLYQALRNGERTFITDDGSSTVACQLNVPRVGVNAFHNVQDLITKVVIVKEDYLARSILYVMEEEKYTLEGAAAVGIAALYARQLPSLKEKKVVCVASGGVISTGRLSRVIERGMAAEKRLVKFKVRVKDKANGMADLYSLLADIGVTLRESLPERAWVQSDIFSVELKVICETRGQEHTEKLMEKISSSYTDYHFLNISDGKKERRKPCRAPTPVCCSSK